MSKLMTPERIQLPDARTSRFFDWVRGSSGGLLTLALAVGLGAGLGAVAFRYLILWFTLVFTGQHGEYSAAGREPHAWLAPLGVWFVVLAPVVGGLVYGPLIELFAPEARGHGVPEVMAAVAQRGGRIRARVALIKSLASAICIGCGGSVGREGPIVQVGSAMGSTLGQLVRAPESRVRLLVACGAAGGISATFNAPIAAVMFALELILRDFEAASFGVVVLSSVAANVVGRAVFGDQAFLVLPTFAIVSFWELLFYVALGLAAALTAVLFIRVLYASEDFADRIWRGPAWLRPAVGGLLLGSLLLVLPELYGVGYPPLEHAIRHEYVLGFVIVLLFGKMLATSITIGIGGSGGVFAPSLFIGAMLGSACGDVVHRILPAASAPPGAYGLVGMGAVFAAAARAPITAALIIFELTDEYRIILPLIFAIAVATWLSEHLTADTIYTLKLRRRGIALERERPPGLMEALTVGDAMTEVPEPLQFDLPLTDTVARFARDQRDSLPVIDGEQRYRGTVSASRVEEAIREGTMDLAIGTLGEQIPTLKAEHTLAEALEALVRHQSAGIPVLDERGHTIVGWLTHRDVLVACHERQSRRASEREAEPARAPRARAR